MATFAQKFGDVYMPTMETMGFKRKGSIFHKLVNDKIVIVLSYKRYGPEFTIQFDFWPLCNGDDIEPFMDSNYLLHEIDSDLKHHNYWTCEIDKCDGDLHESLAYCKNTVFRYFDIITDYQSYYDCVYKIEEERGLYDVKYQTIPYLHLRHFHNTLLALGQFDLALKVKEAEIEQNKSAMECYSADKDWVISRHPRYAKYLTKIEYYEKLSALVDIHNFEEIKQMINQNEEYSRKSYRKNFLGIKSV